MQYFIKKTATEIRLAKIGDDAATGQLSGLLSGFRMAAGRLETWEENENGLNVGFVNRLQRHGYSAISERDYEEYLANAGDLLLPQTNVHSGKEYTIVSWEAIREQFSPGFRNDIEEYLQDPIYRQFCLYPGDTVMADDMVIDFSELGATEQTERRNIVVNGNLIIKGCLDGGNNIGALPQFIYVKGDLTADNVLLSGWLDVLVEGNVIVKDTLLGYDGEPGGRLRVNGNVQAGWLLNGAMYAFDIKGDIEGQWYNLGDLQAFEERHPITKISGSVTDAANYPLLPEVMDYSDYFKEYAFTFEKARDRVRKGERLFK